MQIETRTTDRPALISFLQEETGQRPQYMGAPTFEYVIGPYTVLRNANIETDDTNGEKLLEVLKKNGFADDEEEQGISVSFETDTVRSRMNLLRMICARQSIINKAVDKPDALYINPSFLKNMEDKNPKNLQEFREVMLYYHSEYYLKGVRIYEDRALFTGFPMNGTEYEQNAMQDLVTAMVRAAEHQRWVKADVECPENEKYFFRVWMLSIGLKGREHQKTRSILLRRLPGNAAYRTEEQKNKALNRRKKKEQEADHGDFTIL